ncbi:hypothetical protein FOWG_18250 [Fusarium oxysporum f. sp. lycopersici MN25]|nr:hypothetical protein FOWG_18250 [Fusarium oxysporum f. sp. lycopersici MN25]
MSNYDCIENGERKLGDMCCIGKLMPKNIGTG